MKVTIAVLPFALLVLSARGDTRTLDATDEDLYAVPADLLIGAGVSAFQTEGAWNEDGKAESAADHLFREGDLSSVGVTDRHLQDTAANSYHMYKDDIKMAAELKLKLVRFSLSWSRILPTADASKPNQLGVDYYKSYISEILKYNMTPVATLYHFDHPQILEDQFHGWQSPQMVDKFKEYAEFVFKEFGAMVPFWATLNEPNMYCVYFPGMFLKVGFYKASDEDWYSCIRHVILANAAAYHAFKDAGLQGKIGFTAVLFKGNPVTTNAEDVYAANVYNSLQSGIILDPVIHGDYSQTAKDVLGDHLTPFTEEEKKRIKGTSDFLGLNIYYGGTVEFLRPNESSSDQIPSSSCPVYSMPFYTTHPNLTGINYGMMRESLLWAWNNYRVPLLVTESGIGDDTLSPAYHSENLRALVKTMKEFQVKVIGYAAWSLIDAFEFTSGFKKSFGLVHVDYQNGTLARSHKKSSEFWIQLGETGIVPLVKEPSSASSAICVSASILLFSASSVLSFSMF